MPSIANFYHSNTTFLSFKNFAPKLNQIIISKFSGAKTKRDHRFPPDKIDELQYLDIKLIIMYTNADNVHRVPMNVRDNRSYTNIIVPHYRL